MLISGTAGMGKYTVLKQPSKQIKQKFPTKCGVRNDINDHTDVPNIRQQKFIDEEKATEFFAELLKIQRGVCLALYKQCCEPNQMVD